MLTEQVQKKESNITFYIQKKGLLKNFNNPFLINITINLLNNRDLNT